MENDIEWIKKGSMVSIEGRIMVSKWQSPDGENVERYLINEWVPWRLKFTTKTRAIIDKKSIKHESGSYSDYHETTHETLIIDDPFFSISNEIIIH